MRMLVSLLEFGSEEERAATPAGELSPLFEGGHGEWVKSLTAISAPHDGTTFTHAFPKLMVGVTYGVLALGSVIGNTGANSVYDFHMEQWGLTEVPGNLTYARNMFNIKAIRKIVKSKDNVFADLRIDQAMDMNRDIKTSPNVYYFSVAGNGTKPVGDGTYVRDKIMIFAFIPFAKVMGRFPLRTSTVRKSPKSGDRTTDSYPLSLHVILILSLIAFMTKLRISRSRKESGMFFPMLLPTTVLLSAVPSLISDRASQSLTRTHTIIG